MKGCEDVWVLENPQKVLESAAPPIRPSTCLSHHIISAIFVRCSIATAIAMWGQSNTYLTKCIHSTMTGLIFDHEPQELNNGQRKGRKAYMLYIERKG